MFSQVQDYVNLRVVQMFYWSILFNKSLCYSTVCCILVSSWVEIGGGQGGLACCGSWDRKESDTTERLK